MRLIKYRSDCSFTGGSQQASLFDISDIEGRAHLIVAEPHSFMAISQDSKRDYYWDLYRTPKASGFSFPN